MNQHTPGPWKVYFRKGKKEASLQPAVICDAEGAWEKGLFVATMNAVSGSVANARLIAKAPEMLDILQYVAEEMRYVKGCQGGSYVSVVSGGSPCGHSTCTKVREARALLREIEEGKA